MRESSHRHAASIIRWAGSKRSLLQTLLDRCPTQYNTYIEPFAGSACLFFALAPANAILGDTNKQLIETYTTLRDHPTRVLNLLNKIPKTQDEYYRIRASVNPQSKIARAVKFLYINRFCFNGIYRTNKKGEFNVPFGTRTGNFPSIEEFKLASNLLKAANIVSTDFEDTMRMAKKGDFVYLDPPYSSSNRNDRNEYGTGSFTHKDLPRLIQRLKNIHSKGVHFLLSYGLTDEIEELLPCNLSNHTIEVRRHIAASANKRGMAKEILVSNIDLFGTTPTA